MKIEIESDVFDITKRIKEIDEGYYIVLNNKNNKFELHNKFQINTYCLQIPFDSLDKRVIDVIHASNVCNIDNIINNIDKNNKYIENESFNNIKDQSSYMLNEIYNFCNNSSKSYVVDKAFKNVWR